MKTLLSIGLIVLIILSCGFYTYNALDSQSAKMYEELHGIEKYVYADKWDMASIQYSKMNSKWEREKKVWSLIVDHFEIDNINIQFSELEAFLRTKSQADALSRLSVLKTLVRHIPEKESLSFKNIL